jgi:ABC-2 type transport system ATP-binding protein
MIDVLNISKNFGGIKALDSVNLSVKKGEIFGVLGPDGAGKTTLMRIICNLMLANEGKVSVPEGIRGTGRLGYMPQKFSLYGDMTIIENIHLYGELFGLNNKIIDERADRILEMTGIIKYKDRFADKLSGGMKQKLAITVALMTEPELLILDEPTYGIDPVSRQEIWKLLIELNAKGITIMVSTPYMNEAEMCHRVAYLDSGIQSFIGTPREFKKLFPEMFFKAPQKVFEDVNKDIKDTDYAIVTSKLSKSFDKFVAVNKVEIKVPKGKIYGFLGPNGAGKTTLIKMLCGLMKPSNGSAMVLGYDLSTQTEDIKHKIGYMSQKYSLYDDLTVKENLEFFAGIYGIPKGDTRKNRILEVIKMANLVGKEDILAGNLSLGLKQRLALGSAILAKPELIFLDEPTSGVSPITRRDFFQVINKLADEGVTVIVTTHFMDEAERCDILMFLLEGKLIAEDTPYALKQMIIDKTNPDPSLDDVFVYLTKMNLGDNNE